MDYRNYKVKNDGIDLMTDHFSLTKEELESAKAKVNEIFGREVKNIVTTGRGVAFIGAYNTVLADFTFISSTGQFELHYNKQAEAEIARKAEIARRKRVNEHRKRRKRKLVLQKTAAFVLIAGITAGSIWGLANKNSDMSEVQAQDEIVNVVGVDVKSISNSEVEVVVEWLDYAMNGFFDTCDSSPYRDYVMPQYEDAYQSYFIPAHSAYSDWEEMEATGLPDDIIGDSKKNTIARVYSNANELNEVVPNAVQFMASPYSRAITVEMEDGRKEVYIPFDEIVDLTDYSINNLPENAKIVEGKIYVSSDYLREVEHNLSK